MPKKISEVVEINGHTIELTSLDKPYWPDDELTKGDALNYYRAVADVMLPYLAERPVTFRAYPNGINGPGFWRRDLPDNAPDWLMSVRYQPETREERIDVPLIDDEAALIWWADHAAIEVHQWLSLKDDLDRPDWAVFDLDPGKELEFEQILEAATLIRDDLTEQGLKSFAKTSGASGMHVFVPLKAEAPFDDVRDWVHGVARRLAEKHPKLIAAASGGTHRGSVVTIDHAQNSVARNTAAPFTLRARPGATVSTPLSWDEVEKGKFRPDDFTLRTVPKRLKKQGDPWDGALNLRQKLP